MSLKRPAAWEAVVTLSVGTLLLGALLWWVFSQSLHEQARRQAAARAACGLVPGDRYVGSRVCGECHPGEYALNTR